MSSKNKKSWVKKYIGRGIKNGHIPQGMWPRITVPVTGQESELRLKLQGETHGLGNVVFFVHLL